MQSCVSNRQVSSPLVLVTLHLWPAFYPSIGNGESYGPSWLYPGLTLNGAYVTPRPLLYSASPHQGWLSWLREANANLALLQLP